MAPEHYIAIDIPHVRAEIAGRIMPLHDVLTQKLEAPTTTCGFIPSRQVSPSFYFAVVKTTLEYEPDTDWGILYEALSFVWSV